MAKPLPSDSPFSFTLFKRLAVDGHVVFYARFMEKATGTILSQRSMGTDDEREAAAQAGRLMTQLPLANIAKAKASHAQDDFESAESLRNMDLASYFTWFWTPGVSAYLRDRIEAEKPLSNYYVQTQGRYINKVRHWLHPLQEDPPQGGESLLVRTVDAQPEAPGPVAQRYRRRPRGD